MAFPSVDSKYTQYADATELAEEYSKLKLHKNFGITLIVIGIIALLGLCSLGGLGLLQSNQIISLSQSWFIKMVDSLGKGGLWGLIGAGVVVGGFLIGAGSYLVHGAKKEMPEKLDALHSFLDNPDEFANRLCLHTFMDKNQLMNELPKGSYRVVKDGFGINYVTVFKSEEGELLWDKKSSCSFPEGTVAILDAIGYVPA